MSDEQKDDGGLCPRCDQPGTHRSGRQVLCVKHYRFGSMRSIAKRDSKSVPTHLELDSLFSALDQLKCPHCERRMNWQSKDGPDTVISLQHNRDGTHGF